MPSSKDMTGLGDKVGPKISAHVVQAVIAAKKGLMSTDRQVRSMAIQDVINKAGEEVGDHFGGVINLALAHPDNANIHPELRKFLENTASGHDQWKAITGAIGISSSLLGSAISNAIAPTVYELNRLAPNTLPDTGTVAQLYAQGLASGSVAYDAMQRLGIQDGWIDSVLNSAKTTPDINTLAEFYHRGLMQDQDTTGWYERTGLPTELIQLYKDIRPSLLTVADAALGVLRSDLTLEQGREIANANGYTDDSFNTLLLNTGEPPGAQDLGEMLRRGFINEDLYKLGILQSRIRNEWIPYLLDNVFQPPSTADSIEASIQGYMSYDTAKAYAIQNGLEEAAFDPLWLTAGEPLSRTEMQDLVNRGFADVDQLKAALQQSRLKDSYIDLAVDLLRRPMTIADAVEAGIQGYLTEDQARKIAAMNGLRDEDFDPLYLTAGNPLSLTEMLRLWNRGEVTEDQVRAALRESRLKDSYIDLALNLRTALPSIYDVRTFLADGVLTDAQATEILTESGYPDYIVKAIITAAATGGTTANKTVTEAQLVDLYIERALTSSELIEMLGTLGYSAANAALIQEVADLRIELAARNALISKVRTLYVGRKINDTTAQNDLNAALIPANQVTYLLGLWNLELEASVKTLTEAQIIDAWSFSLYNPDNPQVNTTDATIALEGLGYSGDDALMILKIKNKAPTGGFFGGGTTAGTANTSG